MSGLHQKIRNWATQLKQQTYALYLASRSSQVPFIAKLLIVMVVAYALSPIDLIPDFIPLIGYLDDLLLLPMGIWLAIKLIPKPVWQQCLLEAQQQVALPKNRRAAVVIVVIWLLAIGVTIAWLFSLP